MASPIQEYLRTFVTQRKLDIMQECLERRTRAVTFAFEDFYYPHNIHASLRSIECCGFQDIHIIDNKKTYGKNVSVTKGAEYWLSVNKYAAKEVNNTQVCFEALRAQGYTIVGAALENYQYTVETLPLDTKLAIVFGSEETGLSEYARAHVDGCVIIPMHGFTQSLNVSVSVGIMSYVLGQRLRRSDLDWHLVPEEKDALELTWLRRVVKHADLLEKDFYKK